MSRTYFTSILRCIVERQKNDPLKKLRKFKIPEQLIKFKLSQKIKTTKKIKKIKMEIIIPVVTEDIVAHLLRNINKDHKFFNMYKLIVSEANLVAAWLEIKSKFRIFTKDYINNTSTANENLPLKWFKETSVLLFAKKYNYKLIRTMKISKKEKRKSRKLTIADLYNTIIQKAFHRILNVMFEGYSE
jgi:hypothetical protein